MNNTPANITPEIDVEAQWQKFSASHLPHRQRVLPRWAVAACFCLVVGVALAMTLPRLLNDQPQIQQPRPAAPVLSEVMSQDVVAATSFVFHDVSLQQVLDTLSAYYHVNIIYINKEAAQLRLYTQIEKDLMLSQAVSLLNQLGGISLRIENEDTLLVE